MSRCATTNVTARAPTRVRAPSSAIARRASARSVQTRAAQGKVLLEVKDLHAKVAETGEEILKGVNLTIREGETHAVMGKNGSGKSTLTKVLVGHPAYEVTSGSATFKGEALFEMEPEERARSGLFLSFQSPIEVPGVSNTDFLRMMCNERRKARGEEELDPLEFYGYLTPKLEALNMDPSFLTRNVNEGFSGGEKKRNEILQLAVMESEMSILDEIDSGLDVDALRDVAKAVNLLRQGDKGLLLITHYQRLLDAIHPGFRAHHAKGANRADRGSRARDAARGGWFRVARAVKVTVRFLTTLLLSYNINDSFNDNARYHKSLERPQFDASRPEHVLRSQRRGLKSLALPARTLKQIFF